MWTITPLLPGQRSQFQRRRERLHRQHCPGGILEGTGNENPQGASGASVNTRFLNAPNTPQAYNGQPVSYMQYNQAIPHLYNWNLTVQRQLSGDMMAEVGYVGSHGTNLLFNRDANQVPVSLLAPNDQASRPFPQYQAISGFSTQGLSDYQRCKHSLSAA